MSKALRLSPDLSLPLDAVTQTFLIVGKRGSGKSNTAARFVEQLYHAGLPFVVLDPVDTWWGLKAGRDGGRGLDVYVFGGRKFDLPLEAGSGALIADVLCEHRMSMVLSVKHLSGGERSRFMVAFAQTLFQKWGGGPLHVVLEEAHELAPQMSGGRGNADSGDAAMLGAFKRLWKLGRASGIGGTAVTQRPASLSKDITTQSEILIAHRTIGPQDVKAIGEWVKYHGEHQDILADLPSLPTGEAFVWAPEFPEGKPIGLQRTTVLLRETYDSASTPKVGEHRVEPKELAAVDLERLRTKMAATIEKAKQDDPKELRKELARVRQELSTAQQVTHKAQQASAASVHREKQEVPVLTDADRELLRDVKERIDASTRYQMAQADAALTAIAERAKAVIDAALAKWSAEAETARAIFAQRFEKTRVQKVLDKLDRVTVTPKNHDERPGQSQPLPAAQLGRTSVAARPAAPAVNGTSVRDPEIGNSGLSRMLIALAQRPQGLTRAQLGIRAGLSPKTGTFATYLGKMRNRQWVEDVGAQIRITAAGRAGLGSYEPLPEGPELATYWMRELGGGAARMLQVIVSAHPRVLTREELGEAANLSPATGTFATYLGKLRGLELISSRGDIVASEELFE